MERRMMCVALATLFVSTLAPILPLGGVALAVGAVDATGFTIGVPAAPTLDYSERVACDPPGDRTISFNSRYESSSYRPRRERYRYRESGGWFARGVTQVHAGFLDPEGDAGPGFVVGLRGGQQIDDMIQFGLGADWRNKSGRATEVLQRSTGPGGETIVSQRDLSKYSSNLFPTLAYLQISGPSNLTLVPYAGIAASWQILFLSADDFQTGQSFDATYDGFGWQAWAGAALPLSGRSRLVGEVFLNNADLSRDVFDAASGSDIHETISTDGVGARFGMSWGF